MASPIVALDIQSDVDRMVKQMGADVRQVPKALNSTINKTATTIRKEGVRQLAKETGIKQKDIRRDVVIRKSNFQTLSARIRATGSFTNLIRFGARQTKKGVSAAPWKKRRVFKGAFIANKGRTVFVRKGKSRLPIQPVFGPSLPREFLKKKIITLFNAVGLRRFRELFPKELKFRMGKGKR